jgi:GNAT superfamily N-acetyltransferase
MKVEGRIRPAEAGDEGLLFSSWLNSYRDKMATAREGQAPLCFIPSEAYFNGQRALIADILRRKTTRVLCFVNQEHTDQVYGWACFEQRNPWTLHYVCVRKLWRHMGVAGELLAAANPRFRQDTIAYTHHTHHMVHIAPKWRALYNPYLAR